MEKKVKKLLAIGPSKLATFVLDGKTELECDLPKDDVLKVYGALWKTKRKFSGLGGFLVGPKINP